MGKDDDPGSTPRRGLTRRGFLGFLGGGTAAATLAGCDPIPGLPGPTPQPAPVPPLPSGLVGPSLVLRRREDQLRLEIRLLNLRATRGPNGLQLERTRTRTGDAYVIVDFGPQSIGEQAINEEQTGPPARPLGSRLANPTRVAFRLPASTSAIPFSFEALLRWGLLEPSLKDEVVQPLQPSAPAAHETAIEVPWGLILSPTPTSRWAHTTALSIEGPAERRELWRTELVGPIFFNTGERILAGVRPEWQYGTPTIGTIDPPGFGKPFDPMTLSPRDRRDIITNARMHATPPIRVERLALSMLGASADLDGGPWGPADGGGGANNLVAWRHRSTLGRDHYVRTVRRGWLFPWGHRATKITITERQFRFYGAAGQDEQRYAELRQRTFLVIGERDRTFGGRDLPFKAVRCNTTITPNLVEQPIANVDTNDAWVATIANQGAYEASFVGTDWAGRSLPFTGGVVFVAGDITSTSLDRLTTAFADLTDPTKPAPSASNPLLRTARRNLSGRTVAVAQPSTPGNTDFAVRELDVVAHRTAPGAPVPYLPAMRQARGQLPQAAGLPADPGGTAPPDVTLEYYQPFLDNGYANNASEVFAKLGDNVLQVAKGTATGLVNGGLAPGGLSRKAGAVLGKNLANVAAGNFDPLDFFGAGAPKLLGVVNLVDLFEKAVLDSATGALPSDAVRITNERTDEAAIVNIHWEPKIKKLDNVFVTYPVVTDGKRTSFEMDIRSVTSFDDPSASRVDVRAELHDVQLDLLSEPSFLTIDVDRVVFTSGSDRKPDVDIVISDVEFGEALDFVNKLATYMGLGGDGLSLDVDATGVTVSYALALPSLQLGMFALQNLAIGLGVRIPFVNEPLEVYANFSSRDNPFLITVSMLGGGGWAEFRFTADKVLALEVGLEFGGDISIDIGVASGGVRVTAGVMLAMGYDDQNRQTTVLEGFVRLCGEIDVLGIITVSAEFYMGLAYISLGGGKSKVRGKATLIIEVDVLCFGGSVECTVEKTFSNSPGDPTFVDLIPLDPGGGSSTWEEYCMAFGTRSAA